MNEPSRTLVIIMYSDLLLHGGGRESWLAAFLKSEKLRGSYSTIRVFHFTAGADGPTIDATVHFPTVSYHAVDLSRPERTARKLIKFFRFCMSRYGALVSGPADIVAVGSFYETIAAKLVDWRYPWREKTIVSWFRSIWDKQIAHFHTPREVRLISRIESFFLRRTDIRLANGPDTARYYREVKGIDSVNVPNGIDLTRFPQNSAVLAGDRVTVLFVGRLSIEKGLRSFLQAIRILNERGAADRFRFVIAGDGPLEEEVQELVRSGLIDHRGAIDNRSMPALYAEADVAVQLTYSKTIGGGGISHSLLEAMASGLLNVCWDSTIYRQVLDDGSGVFVEEAQDDQLARALLMIADDRTAARSRADKGRHVSTRYDFSVNVDTYLQTVIHQK